MLFDPHLIKIMREALAIAEQGLAYSAPVDLDEATRRELARIVLLAVGAGHFNPLVIASIALRAFGRRKPDVNAVLLDLPA